MARARQLTPISGARFKPRFVVVRCTITTTLEAPGVSGDLIRTVSFYVCDMLDGGRVLRQFDAKDETETAIENARKYASRIRVLYEKHYVANNAAGNGNGRS